MKMAWCLISWIFIFLPEHEAKFFVFQGFLQQLRQIMGRMSSGPRGAGLGVKLLIGAGALAYGVKEATYTGTQIQEVKS